MKLRLALFFVCYLPLMSPWAADIYQRVDEQGNISFSDSPVDSSGLKMSIPESPKSTDTPTRPDWQAIIRRPIKGSEKSTKAPAPSITLIAPADDEPVRSNNGVLKIEARLQSAPDSFKVRILLNNETRKTISNQSRTELTNIPRGTHRIQVLLLDSSEQILATSAPHYFHLLRVLHK